MTTKLERAARLILTAESTVSAFVKLGGVARAAATAIATQALVEEIAAIAHCHPAEVKEFYQSHNYSLEHIKHAVLLCGELDEDKMRAAIIAARIIAL